jgi:hypothetical protein
MRTRTLVATLLFVLALGSISRAELIRTDDLFWAVDRAGKELGKGAERQAVLDRLNTAIEHDPNSQYTGLARSLSADLARSIEIAATRPHVDDPNQQAALELMETGLPAYRTSYTTPWEPQIRRFWVEHPRDPITQLLRADRSVIDLLLPLLDDRSPTRAFGGVILSGELPTVPRVCDLALTAIEFQSKCSFQFNASTGTLFHELPADKRAATAAHIKQWWDENRDKPVSVGVRAQLPHAEFYEQMEMATTLARLADNDADRAFAIDVLQNATHMGITYLASYAADALAELGDYTALDVFYNRMAHGLTATHFAGAPELAWYLMQHGGRREWELLNKLAVKEIDQGLDLQQAGVWPALANGRESHYCRYAIPAQGEVLTRAGRGGREWLEDLNPSGRSNGDYAIDNLQRLTGRDFGYRWRSTVAERGAAIRRAQEWWTTEGRKLYTFEYAAELEARRLSNRLDGITDPWRRDKRTPPWRSGER